MPMDRGTPDLVRHCVAAVAKQYGGDTSKAFAICVAQLQKNGYLKPGTMELTAAGKKKEKEHESEPDAAKKLKSYEKLLKANRKEEAKGKTFAQAHAEIMAGLAKDGWKVQTKNQNNMKPLLVPHATSPDGKHRLYFKKQAIYLSKDNPKNPADAQHDLNSALSLHMYDVREMDYPAFLQGLKGWIKESVDTDHNAFFEQLANPTVRSGFEGIPTTVARRYDRREENESPMDAMRRLAGII